MLEPLFYVGGSLDRAYLRCVDTKGNQYTYSTVKVSREGPRVERTQVHEKYIELFESLLKRCDFQEVQWKAMQTKQENCHSRNRHSDDETVWLCRSCKTANAFRNKFCSTCGAKREW